MQPRFSCTNERNSKCGKKFIQLSGRCNFSTFLVNGGVGCISVTANVTPRLCAHYN